ncbi:TlpA disulfide reductase family protein [Thiohalomonas denitrificans]|uniref:TlpA disulfide reductase family protein n=1 Tax=Thiohalomonas denitrificans TaxID=415747 RepID=UPI0026EFF8C5|nr:TlpA disulfide reductase family protein [Thiohalomonas denitrificans]
MLSVSIGPFATSFDRLLPVVAVLVALTVGALLGRRRGVATGGTLLNLVWIGIVVARIGFVLRYMDEYRDDWLGALDIRDGGFDVASGLVAALAAAAWILWRTPAVRKPLGAALLAGGLSWGSIAGVVTLIETQSRAMPQVTLQTLGGARTDLQALSANSGQPMVVNLWATWCPPCRREMPVLEAAQQEHPDINFVFANQGEGAAQIQQFIDESSLTLDNVVLDRGGALGQTVGSMALPTTLFYDADGRLVNSHTGELSRATLARGLRRFDNQ